MMNVRNAVLLVSVLALTGCVADSESAEPAVSAEEEPLLGGVASNSLPMVGLFSFTNMGDCTATMISRRYFVTAAHCIGYQPRLQSGVNGTATLTLTAVPGLGVLPVAQVFAFAGNPSKYTSFSCPFSMNPYCSTGVGEFDIALGQLAAPLPVSPNWTPAPMSSVEPVSNQVITLVGYGCNTRAMPAPPGASARRVRQSRWGASNVVCPGDSGGPVFLPDGSLAAVISGVNGAGTQDVFADLPRVKVRIERMIRQLEGGLEPGWDRPGIDLYSRPTASASLCRRECLADRLCRAFAWNGTTCYLKDAVANPVINDGVTSGVVEAIDPFVYGTGEPVIDLDGLNLPGMPTSVASVSDCAIQCWSNAQCRAYTFVRGNPNQCWQKRSIPPPIYTSTCATNGSCFSSIRRVTEGRTHDGNDLLPPYASTQANCAADCARTITCQAYTFENDSQLCHIKAPVPPAGASLNVASQVRAGMRYNSAIVGSYYRSQVPTGPIPEYCQLLCTQDASCAAWTLETESSHGALNCRLYRSAAAGAFISFGAVSGLKNFEY